MCDDWPCVIACKPNALLVPECEEGNESIPLPELATAAINTDTCFPYSGPECGACNICPVPNALLWDQQRPFINSDICVGCGLCREACIVQPSAISIVARKLTPNKEPLGGEVDGTERGSIHPYA